MDLVAVALPVVVAAEDPGTQRAEVPLGSAPFEQSRKRNLRINEKGSARDNLMWEL